MLALFVSRLTVVSIIVALFPLGKNIQYFLNSTHFLEECTYNIFTNTDHSLLHYPCFYLELWTEYNNEEVYDNKKYLDAFCTTTIILISFYMLTSVIAVYGIVNESFLPLVPWIILNILISFFTTLLLAAELHVLLVGKIPRLSEMFLINIFSAFYTTFNWIVGAILITKIKKYPKPGDEDEGSRVNYFELQNLNEDA